MFKKTKIQRGVTLIELMVVVVLIGVLAGIASPGIFRAIERQNAVAVAAGVASALRTARNQAMSRGTPVWVDINFGNTAANRGSVDLYTQGTVAGNDAARNCREYAGVGARNLVGSFSPADISGKGAIVRVEPNASLCFSPDGRVLSATGQFLPPVNRCRGDYALIYTADYDLSVTLPLLNCPADAAGLQALRDQRAIARMHQVSVPFNGAIRVEQ